jgi:hypothetical protein
MVQSLALNLVSMPDVGRIYVALDKCFITLSKLKIHVLEDCPEASSRIKPSIIQKEGYEVSVEVLWQ